jgi:FAD/FMN-containing dehydrogenase
VILPRNASEVSSSLQVIASHSVHFAVRSGGHSPNPGWSSIGGDGLLLDLQRMAGVQLSVDGVSAAIGPGARWGDVYAAVDAATASRAIVAGGRVPSIGVGGLVLGGGLSHLSGQFGLVADTARGFEVALANGSVVDATAEANADLFWALKGGGPNFGIVTRYDLYTLPVSTLWVQVSAYAVSDAPAVIAAFDAWQLEGSSDVRSNVEVIISLDYVAVVLIYSEPAVEPPAAFEPFFNESGVQPAVVNLPGTNVTFNELSIILGSVISGEPAR